MNPQNMYQQQPGGATHNTWGNQEQRQQQSFGYTLDEGSSDEYTDSEEESEDDIPLAMSSWGEQTTTKEGTTEYNVSAEGWAALIDPNFKVGPGGVGSGNLHRRGGNYKPVDEEHILNHRLKKGGPMPGTGKKKKRSRGGKSKSASSTPPSSRGGRGRGRGGFPSSSSSSSRSPISAPSRYGREPLSNNAWGAQQLTDKPFWEQPASAAAPSTDYGSGASTSKYAPAGGAAASRYAPQQPQPPPPPQQQQWGQYQEQPQQQQQWNAQQNAGSSTSRYATESTQGSSTSRYATADAGSGASKWASGSSASKYATPVSTGSSADSIYASEEAKKSTPAQQQNAPLSNSENILSINISFMPGVYATLNVPNQTHIDYNKLVEDFVSHHRLQMVDEAKHSFTANVQKLVELEYAKRQQQ